MENFIDVKDYEGLYTVSDFGNVISLNYNHTNKPKKLAFGKHPQGYLTVNLWKEKKKKTFLVHRLVMDSFFGIKEGMEVNHKFGIKHDNRLCQLEIVTPKENVKHSYLIGLKKASFGNAKINFKIANLIREDYKNGIKNKDLCIKYNLTSSTISGIYLNRYWTKQREL